MHAPSLYLEPCHLKLIHCREDDTASNLYKKELAKAGKTKEEGLTIFDYCINHKCYVHEVCAFLDWDVTQLYTKPLLLLQDSLLKAGKIDRPFII
jgi:hypothetical protein